MQDFLEKINQAQEIIITAHIAPDGDAVGSSLAMQKILQKLEKKTTVILPDKIPSALQWLPGAADIVIYDHQAEIAQAHIHTADLIFCLDYNTLARLGKMREYLKTHFKGTYCMIDHHLDAEDFGQLYFGNTAASSTCELIFDWLENCDYLSYLDSESATCLYTGIMTDTGSFRFASTSARTHQIVAYLMGLGILHHEIHQSIYDSHSEERLRLWGFAMYQRLFTFPHWKTAVISLSAADLKQFHYQSGDTEGLVNQLLSIQGTKLAILMTEKEGKVRLSFRSANGFTVNHLAATHFHGGGHANAAGGYSTKSIEDTLKHLTDDVLPQYADELA